MNQAQGSPEITGGIGIINDIILSQHTQQGVSRVLGLLDPSTLYVQVVGQREEIIEKYGIKEYQQLLKDIIWPAKTRVSFEDFKEFLDLRNNFRGYFSVIGNFLYEYSYRSCAFYHRLAQNHTELVEQLISIYDRPDLAFYTESDEEISLLYRAYALMLEDEEVSMNHDLFR